MDISEKNFEAAIERVLLESTGPAATGGEGYAGLPGAWYENAPGGYRRVAPEEYDRASA